MEIGHRVSRNGTSSRTNGCGGNGVRSRKCIGTAADCQRDTACHKNGHHTFVAHLHHEVHLESCCSPNANKMMAIQLCRQIPRIIDQFGALAAMECRKYGMHASLLRNRVGRKELRLAEPVWGNPAPGDRGSLRSRVSVRSTSSMTMFLRALARRWGSASCVSDESLTNSRPNRSLHDLTREQTYSRASATLPIGQERTGLASPPGLRVPFGARNSPVRRLRCD